MTSRTVPAAAALLLAAATAHAQAPIWTLNATGDAVTSAAKVGVGTTAPQHRLDVASGPAWTINNWGGALGLENGNALGWAANTAGQRFGLGHTNGGFFVFRTASNLGTRTAAATVDFMISDAGAVGVGTTAPGGRLHVFDPGDSVTSVIETGGGTNAWAKLRFKNANGLWDVGTSRGFNGDEFYIDRQGTAPIELQLTPGGGLGLGIQPITKLHVFDPASVSSRIETGGGTNAWARIEFVNANGQWNVGSSRSFNGDQFYVARQGSAEIAFSVQPNGDASVSRNLSTRTLTIRGGADLAEPFLIDDPDLARGSVVVIDDQHPGRLTVSTSAYDTRVAGIVSGANGINPGISLQQEGAFDGGPGAAQDVAQGAAQDVALSGRVYVQADASAGPIRPGDLLTTSDVRGHAMKAGDPARAPGAILGKAMSALDRGTGLVLVLVSLQ
ncbi:MAG: hypothetical protein ABI868_25595 [Acidobacteriota bacterium]